MILLLKHVTATGKPKSGCGSSGANDGGSKLVAVAVLRSACLETAGTTPVALRQRRLASEEKTDQ